MPRIILSKGRTVLKEMVLSKERITIGRRPHNDIVIESLAVSGEHAVIVTQNHDAFLEDLNSTNGTKVNGQPVQKHFLQDDDLIELARYSIRYVADVGNERGDEDDMESNFSRSTRYKNTVPRLRVLDGAKAGHEIPLLKPLTTIGKPDVQVAVIKRREGEYYIEHVEGNDIPYVNQQAIAEHEFLLHDGDVIALREMCFQFFLR